MKFGDQLEFHSPADRKSEIVIYDANMSDDVIHNAFDYMLTPERTITRAALLLRKVVHDVDKLFLSSDTTTFDQVKDGDASPPAILKEFFTYFMVVQILMNIPIELSAGRNFLVRMHFLL